MLAPAPATSDRPAAQRFDLALVLSGGGARGFAHIGVLQVVDELRLPADLVVGVSMGSIVGAGYAAGFTPDQMLELARAMRVRSVFRPRPGRQSFADPAGLREAIQTIFGDRTFADLQRELLVVSASVLDGQPFVFRDGLLVDALVASCSIPLLFPPISHQGAYLLDGGLVNALPLGLARQLGARQIVAVDASSHVRHLFKLPVVRHAARGVVRALELRRAPADLSRLRIVSRILHHASQPLDAAPVDVLIRPSFGYRTTYHYQHWQEMVARGRAAAEQVRPELMALRDVTGASA
ncbi:MAG: patatin-like phospholipase family protein [Chloroflexi bacterium]|nr:patatin-like phospholipase family protein [Chloroflexota bacterium]